MQRLDLSPEKTQCIFGLPFWKMVNPKIEFQCGRVSVYCEQKTSGNSHNGKFTMSSKQN